MPPSTRPPPAHAAFFYGTLMAPPVLHRVIWGQPTPPTPAHASLIAIRPALLHAHQRHKIRDADYPAVVPARPSASVRGTLVTGLTDADIYRLDIFEGPEYERRKVKVKLLEGSEGHGMSPLQQQPSSRTVESAEEIEAETYIWIGPRTDLLKGEWDFDEFVRENMQRWVMGRQEERDPGFQDVDDAVAALADKDPTRGRGPNGSIPQQLEKGGDVEKEALKRAV